MAMRSMRSRVAALLCVVATTLAAGCDRHAAYRIGVVLERDGARGAQMAAAAVNAAGGIDGHPVEIVEETGHGRVARTALKAAVRMVGDRAILGVVGHSSSGASLAASQVYNAHH